MNIVLVRPNFDTASISPFLGLGYLSSSLKSYGNNVIIIDNLLHRYNNRDLVRRIIDLKPDCVGITCLSSFYEEAKELSLELKRDSNWIGKVVIGGVHPTFSPYNT